MNLARSNWTGEEIESDEPEGIVAMLPILADVFAFHKPHIGLEIERLRGPRRGVGPGPCTADAGEPHQAIEIEHLGRVVDLTERHARRGRKVVNEDAVLTRWR